MPTLPATQQDAAQLHGELRSQALALATALDRTMARVANARVAVFLAALAFAGATIFHRLPLWGYGLAALAGLGYVALAIWHKVLGNPRTPPAVGDGMRGSYLGPAYSDDEIARFIEHKGGLEAS